MIVPRDDAAIVAERSDEEWVRISIRNGVSTVELLSLRSEVERLGIFFR